MTIECDNLVSSYNKALKRPILNGISCTIEQGEFVALLGLNGAGKSTLMRAILGLVPTQRGEIRINTLTMTPRTLPKIRRDVAMIFQGGGLIRQLSALDNVLCGRLGALSSWETLFGFGDGDRAHALKLLSSLGLEDLAYQKTGKLSGGQQQRVAIARALIQSPKILLADEPIAGLDIMATRQVMDSFAKLHAEGMTVITVLHDLAIASKYAKRAIVLNAGSIVYDGSCHEGILDLKLANR